MYKKEDMTFVVCAYGDNEHLSHTIQSLIMQTVKVKIVISTSTPSQFIKDVAKRYGLKIFVNSGEKGIGADWNFGYSIADTPLITIAHQDDVYEPDYAKSVLKNANDADRPVIIFTDYYEIRNGERVENNKILSVKRKMNSIFKNHTFRKSRFIKRRVLSLGSPICCPSVTYNCELCGNKPFNTKYRNSCDYQTFINLANVKGSFVYIPSILMGHRISEDSTTTLNLASNIRQREDMEIFEEFWPRPIAKLIYGLYSTSEKSNILKKDQ
jgi:hypothetical protein